MTNDKHSDLKKVVPKVEKVQRVIGLEQATELDPVGWNKLVVGKKQFL